jgi:uncharacterized membrane protein YeaQ/YmgE (transglycosylase-associated protein family)
MHLLLSLTTGFVVGVVARIIVPGRVSGGWIMSILIGISGSFVAGYFGRLVGMYDAWRPAGLLMSALGAVALLLGYHALVGPRASS